MFNVFMNCTRPDIACTISKLSRYMSNPNKTHWMAMKRVLGYLKYTQDYALHYNKYPTVLEGYSDANWITRSNEEKSTTDMYLPSVEKRSLGNHPNRHVLLSPQWNLNSLLWIRLVKKLNGS